jgi:predicted enzyme related to lactoylglutathione lyase
MSTKKKVKNSQRKKSPIASGIVWFEIPADDIARARKFYSALFGWKITKFPAAMEDYWHIDTGGSDASPDGGMLKKKAPEHTITNYVSVPSVERAAAKVEKLGGKTLMTRTAVPHMGYFAICHDTEKNMFALWEKDENAK